jgi:uncharacterized protein (DUF1778 family)
LGPKNKRKVKYLKVKYGLRHSPRVARASATFKRFVEALDAPVAEIPTLRRYAREQSPIPVP